MTTFKFKAEKSSGEVYEGTRAAPDKFTLYQDMKREGEVVVYAEEIKEKRPLLKLSFLKGFLSGVSMRNRIQLARNLGNMLSAGLSLGRALSVIERQTTKKGLKTVVQHISSEINRGQSLSEALKQYPAVFSTLFVSMVRAGEESGSLPQSLKTVADQMNSTYLLQKKIRGAMIYPAIIMCVIVLIAILMLIYVVPTLTSVFSELEVDLPWNTQLIITTSAFFRNHTVFALSVIVGLILLLLWARKTDKGKRIIDTTLLHLPVIKNIVRESNSARTGRTLSSLLGSGVEVVQSLEITVDVVQNVHFKEVLSEACDRIKKGEPLSAVFAEHTKLYPVFVGEMVSIGEETGKLGEMLSNIADYYEEEVSQKTKDLSVIVEPVLMIIVGAAVGFFAISMLSPMYSLVNII